MFVISKLRGACFVDPTIIALVNAQVLDAKARIIYQFKKLHRHGK